jgi:hypothetical protein
MDRHETKEGTTRCFEMDESIEKKLFSLLEATGHDMTVHE